jgi:hypothetical protein
MQACNIGPWARRFKPATSTTRVHAALVRRAAESGVSVPELLRAELERLASRPSVSSWLERTRGRATEVDRAEILATLEEQRGAWPDAGR